MNRPKIVVVDSDVAVTQLMEELLDLEGYATQAMGVQDASAAAIQQAQPDLLIIEASHQHPSTTRDLIEQIRHSAGTATMPIIVNSTSRQLLETFNHSHMFSGCTLLEKPFDVDQFLLCLSSAIQMHKLATETPSYVTCT